MCNTGGARRTWLRGVEDTQKRYLITLAGRNLTLLMRVLFGIGTPRSLQGLSAALITVLGAFGRLVWNLLASPRRLLESIIDHCRQLRFRHTDGATPLENRPSSTGC